MRNATSAVVALGLSAVMIAAATSASADKFTLRMASGHPDSKTPGFYVTEMVDYFAPEVQKRAKERTGHDIEFIIAVAGAIVKVNESLEGAQNGLVDIAGGCWCFEPSKLFLHNFQMYLPFGPQDAAQATSSARMTYDQVPWLSETFEKSYNQQLLGLAAIDSYHITTRKPWDKVEDLKGVRIAGAGPNLKWIEFAGAVPVQSNMAEAYQALATGVYDGWIMFPSLTYGFKLYEHAPYYTLIGFGSKLIHGLTINNQSLAKLPPDVQKILFEVGTDYEARVGKVLSETSDGSIDLLRKAGATVRTLPGEVRQKWAESLRGWPNEQAQDANKRGMPGSKVMQADLVNSEKAGYAWPVRYEIKDAGS
jgi:TRAP-type C4-dicarboxylate transport system substrate-binding protein